MTNEPTEPGKCRKRGHSSSWITKVRRLALYLRDGFTCLYCGCDLHGADPFNVTLDHLQAGHTNHASTNLVTACRSCNSSRQDKPWKSYATGGAVERINRHRRRDMDKYIALAKALILAPGPDSDPAF